MKQYKAEIDYNKTFDRIKVILLTIGSKVTDNEGKSYFEKFILGENSKEYVYDLIKQSIKAIINIKPDIFYQETDDTKKITVLLANNTSNDHNYVFNEIVNDFVAYDTMLHYALQVGEKMADDFKLARDFSWKCVNDLIYTKKVPSCSNKLSDTVGECLPYDYKKGVTG